VFSGAVGVGVGIGLQKIVANFISGIILLADKSVKPGRSFVTIGDSSGRISAMKTRYISVAAGDGREFLIPNEDLVTQKVTTGPTPKEYPGEGQFRHQPTTPIRVWSASWRSISPQPRRGPSSPSRQTASSSNSPKRG